MNGSLPRLIRFGTYVVDPASGELRRAGRSVRIQELPFRLLVILLNHRGELVSRDELRQKLWGDTHVEFEEGLNTAVRKLRDALGDSAANPRFVETLPRRGYRFIAPVEFESVEHSPEPSVTPRRSRTRAWVFGGVSVLLAVLGWLVWNTFGRQQVLTIRSELVQVTRDSGLTTDPAISRDGKLLAYASDRGGARNLHIWVQQLPGAGARRLTEGSADNYEPDISPDGSEVLFRSERDGGGLYRVSALGGEPHLFIRSGYLPRFSPDGRLIAYALGWFGSGSFLGKLHVFNQTLGSSRELAPDLSITGAPAWSPDGKLLFVTGSKPGLPKLYLWAVGVDDGRVTRMSEVPVAEEPIFVSQVRTASVAWFGGQLITSLKHGDSANLWAAPVSFQSRRLAAPLHRLTVGSGSEVMPVVSNTGKLVFTSHAYSTGIWEATLAEDAAPDERMPALRRLVEGSAVNYRPSVSGDGSKLLWISDRSGSHEVWMKDLPSGREVSLTPKGAPQNFASISRDGRMAAYWDGSALSVVPTEGGTPRVICQTCGRPDDWTLDGKILVWLQSGDDSIAVLDPATGASTKILVRTSVSLAAPSLSADGKWVAFHVTNNSRASRRVFVAPYTGAQVPESEWIAITDGGALDREARWSTDGSQIYFLSDRDGFRCVWSRKLNPATKRPVGEVHPVLHFHDARLSLLHVPNTGHVSMCVVGNKLILAAGELTGNLWLADLGS